MDGISYDSPSFAVDFSYDSNSLFFGTYNGASNGFLNIVLKCVYIYEGIAHDEHARKELFMYPYLMFGRSSRAKYFYVAAGGADDLLLLRGNLRGNFHELSGGLN